MILLIIFIAAMLGLLVISMILAKRSEHDVHPWIHDVTPQMLEQFNNEQLRKGIDRLSRIHKFEIADIKYAVYDAHSRTTTVYTARDTFIYKHNSG